MSHTPIPRAGITNRAQNGFLLSLEHYLYLSTEVGTKRYLCAIFKVGKEMAWMEKLNRQMEWSLEGRMDG